MARERTRNPAGLVALCALGIGLAPIAARGGPAAATSYITATGELDAAGAGTLAALSLSCLDRPFPNKPGHVVETPGQFRAPKDLTPAFYGCFDWHSAVHGHWALVRILKTFPKVPGAAAIRAALDRHLRPDVLAREQAFFKEARNKTFERPYGWAWYLRLAAELATWDDPDGRRWAAATKPLAGDLARALVTYLGRLSVPVREGVHPNTAFALAHAWDYATATGDDALKGAIDAAARRFYLSDRACPLAYEPSGEDFLSPCLAEADLMRRILPYGVYRPWLDDFLPDPDGAGAAPLLDPPVIRDREDPRIGHLIGLDFQRAWTLEGIASVLPSGDPHSAAWRTMAATHRQAGLRDMIGSGYGGEHWLASFALYLLTGVGR
jgi:hypothetical protein